MRRSGVGIPEAAPSDTPSQGRLATVALSASSSPSFERAAVMPPSRCAASHRLRSIMCPYRSIVIAAVGVRQYPLDHLRIGDRPKPDRSRHDHAVRTVLDRFRGREVATTGDGFVAMFDGAERAIHAAQEIGRAASGIGLEIRAAVHTGEIELEGGKRRDDAHCGADRRSG